MAVRTLYVGFVLFIILMLPCKYFFSSDYLAGLDLTVQWSDASDDASVNNATQCLLRQGIEYAKQENLYKKYIYLNYAIEPQDPIAGYGNENREFLRKTSRKYDPQQVFQKLVPGGFKLYRREEICC